ncbi:MbtH family protein [Embleya sp. NPDC055664]|uniref:MbtH family protein n=1 Tax=Embleya sp. NPDC059237 TaxID=3346784 RepID=UPI00368F6167
MSHPTNPFEDNDATYLVLVNDENQHSLWPATLDVPAGWTVTHPEADRQTCLDHVEHTWTDMRPRTLIDAMNARER